MNRVDAADVRRQVEKARALVRGKRACLVGFEAVEIQRFVAASSRPITIQGACETLKAFDERNNAHAGIIFAGGARGLMLVPEEARDSCIHALKRDFAAATQGLSLSVAQVPFDPEHERESLQWLWLEQRSAHDACDPEPINLAAFGGTPCVDCRARPGELRSPKPEAPADEKICLRCDALIKRGRDTQHAALARWTLEDLSEKSLLAVVSADGNRLGPFFRSLQSLEALRAGSLLVADIFEEAHRTALQTVGERFVSDPTDMRHIAPITGGDDIKVFLLPTAALEYVGALMDTVATRARRAGDVGGLLAGESAKRLAELGIGVGLLIAPFHVPATRLVEQAHALEDEAKVRSRVSGQSAVCFSVQHHESEPDDRPRPTVDAANWSELVRRARLLRELVPGSQRAAAAAAWELEDAERDNQLLYQLARSRAWQAWYEACGVRWQDRKEALRLLGEPGVLALATLGGPRGRKQAS